MSSKVDVELSTRISNYEIFRNSCSDEITRMSEDIARVFQLGRKLLICGNGGSAADAQHLAAEFVSSFALGLERPSLPAIALTVDTSVLTAISNDFDFDLVFSRQVQGLGVRGDAFLAISTSGESPNCVKAAEEARRRGLCVLALTRKDSTLYRLADTAVGVPLVNTQHIQECHIMAYHIIAENVELSFLKGS